MVVVDVFFHLSDADLAKVCGIYADLTNLFFVISRTVYGQNTSIQGPPLRSGESIIRDKGTGLVYGLLLQHIC